MEMLSSPPHITHSSMWETWNGAAGAVHRCPNKAKCLPLCWELALSHLPGENWWSNVPEGANPELLHAVVRGFQSAAPVLRILTFRWLPVFHSDKYMTNPFQVYFQKLPFPGDHRGWDCSPSICYWKFEGNSLHLLNLRNIDQIKSCPHSFGMLFSSLQTCIWESK